MERNVKIFLALQFFILALLSTANARFVSTDPVQFNPEQPHMLNRYNYAAGDPINMIDPDGREVIILNSRPFAGTNRFGAEHQALIGGNDKTGWTYVSKDGAVGGGFAGSSDYTVKTFATFGEAAASPELARYDQAIMHVPDDISAENIDSITDAVVDAAKRLAGENYNFATCNCGDLVNNSLKAGGVALPDTVNPQASISNMTGSGDVLTNPETGDKFLDVSRDLEKQ